MHAYTKALSGSSLITINPPQEAKSREQDALAATAAGSVLSCTLTFWVSVSINA